MNTKRTSGSIRAETVPTGLYVVRDRNDSPWGPFKSAHEASEWAEKKWPDVPPFEEGLDPDNCWDVVVLWSPEP
jgi:hypothetical protein